MCTKLSKSCINHAQMMLLTILIFLMGGLWHFHETGINCKKSKVNSFCEFIFLAHLSQRLKELLWSNLSVVHCPSSSLYTFHISIFFSRTTEPVSTKLGIKHSWVKGIQVYSNEGPSFSSRGDNCEIKEMHWWHFIDKFFFSRTTGLTSTEFGAKHPLLKGIQICLHEGPREIIRE